MFAVDLKNELSITSSGTQCLLVVPTLSWARSLSAKLQDQLWVMEHTEPSELQEVPTEE